MKYKSLEKIVKGFSNHRRIQILELIEKGPISLSKISSELKVNLKTISEHSAKLHSSGLIDKNYRGREVVHKITPLGLVILTFLRKLE